MLDYENNVESNNAWPLTASQLPCKMTRINTNPTPSSVSRAEAILRARRDLRPDGPWFRQSPEAEGGCGVTGFACSIPLGGRHIYEPSIQMRNRGNGKGGGIAACGLVPEDLGVSRKVLDEDYILQIALLDPEARGQIEKKAIEPYFHIHHGGLVPTVDDYRDVPLLEVRPPEVARYFVRVKPQVLERFAEAKALSELPERELEDEFVYQNSVRLNDTFYASLGEKQAFVLSHARNLLVMKIVGYAEAAVQYYHMPDMRAHVWIAHQRYPTKGRVWHPGGAHPFVGLHEALVHNGDFANYHSVSEYLAARNIFPRFLTDTEVSVLLFDLWNRVYKYPVEYIIEALAPTTELDFDRLPPEKQRIYRQIQATHIHGSPDGPWFFIIARSLAESGQFQLVGITDTAMLRPQVFALQEGEVSIGLICSEKQAIDATLAGLAGEDRRFTPVADRYWNARGGSHTDGGAFLMTVSPTNGKPASGQPGNGQTHYELTVADKFGNPVTTPPAQFHCDLSVAAIAPTHTGDVPAIIEKAIAGHDAESLFRYLRGQMEAMDYDRLRWLVDELVRRTAEEAAAVGIEVLTLAIDRRYPTGSKKRSSVLTILRQGLQRIFEAQPLCDRPAQSAHCRVTWDTRKKLRGPEADETTLLIDARGFSAEGADCDAAIRTRLAAPGPLQHPGHAFPRGGFRPGDRRPADRLLRQPGRLSRFRHGRHGGLRPRQRPGSALPNRQAGQAGRLRRRGTNVPLRRQGRGLLRDGQRGRAAADPKVVINGTALDFLAESFMAGDPLAGGGFAVVNGLRFDAHGKLVPLDLPYPGSNLLSLASGGAIYVRDPHHTLVDQQLNAGMYRPFSAADWKLVLPYLQENERLFGIRIEQDLLTVDGVLRDPEDVYRKVAPRKDAEIEAELEGMGD